jgi:hypothetical protein
MRISKKKLKKLRKSLYNICIVITVSLFQGAYTSYYDYMVQHHVVYG